MAGVIYFNFEHKLNKFILVLKRIEFLAMNHGFMKLKIAFNHLKVHQALKERLRAMKDQFINNLKKKEQEIQILKKAVKAQEETYSGLKSHEVELVKTLNSKSKIITTLEQKKKPFPSFGHNENSAKKLKFYDEKVFFFYRRFDDFFCLS
jgi:Skp family chaperone for outer membrane proteins